MSGCDRLISYLPQDRRPIDVSLAQGQHFLPRRESSDPPDTNKLRKRTFLFQPNRTFLFQYYKQIVMALHPPYPQAILLLGG